MRHPSSSSRAKSPEDLLRQRLLQGSQDLPDYTSLAELELSAGRADQCAAFLRGICRSSLVCILVSQTFLEVLKRPFEAKAVLLHGHRLEPGCAEVCWQLGLLQHDQSDEERRQWFSKAAELYKVQQSQGPPHMRSLLHLGEALLLLGRCELGRQYLLKVVNGSDAHYKVLAATSLARSHAHSEDYELVLKFCDMADSIATQAKILQKELKTAGFFRGLGLLRGHADIERSASAFQAARTSPASSSFQPGDEDMLIASSCFLEAFRGNFLKAASLLPDVITGVETMVAQAYLFQCQGDLGSADRLLRSVVEASPSHKLACLRLGVLHLNFGYLSHAIDLFQRCVAPHGSHPNPFLSFGRAERGAAFLYLCVAHAGEEVSVGNYFQRAWELLPPLRRFLSSAWRSQPPSRVGFFDITAEQAAVLVRVASSCVFFPSSEEAGLNKQVLLSLVSTASTSVPMSDCSEPTSPETSNGFGDYCDMSLIPVEKRFRYEDFLLEDCLSSGETTTVHRGVLLPSGEAVVVKTRKGCEETTSKRELELLSELQIMASLCHPRLVTFIGAVMDPMQLSLVTSLAEGGNLHHALHVRRVEYCSAEKLRLACELLEGVEYLHTRSPAVLHLDLKPMNLVLDGANGEHLKICDFGMAKLCGDSADDFRGGGSPRYMAPESHDPLLGPLTTKTDIWSTGCILIELFDSSLPYAECSNLQQILKIMFIYNMPPSIPNTIEPRIRVAISWALAMAPEDRECASVLLSLLQRELDDLQPWL